MIWSGLEGYPPSLSQFASVLVEGCLRSRGRWNGAMRGDGPGGSFEGLHRKGLALQKAARHKAIPGAIRREPLVTWWASFVVEFLSYLVIAGLSPPKPGAGRVQLEMPHVFWKAELSVGNWINWPGSLARPNVVDPKNLQTI